MLYLGTDSPRWNPGESRDVQGLRVIAFLLQPDGRYQECDVSEALSGLKISLVGKTFARLADGTNGSAAQWFAQQIAS